MFYFPIVYFFLLYLELQRSDDAADSALWVCSCAGAAQRQASKMRQARASFHSPHSLWPAGCRLLHFQPALLLNAPNSQIIGVTQSVFATYSSVPDSISVRKLFIGCQVPSAQCFNLQYLDLYEPRPPLRCYGSWEFASLVFQVFRQWLLSAAVSPGHSAGAAAKWPLPRARWLEQH